MMTPRRDTELRELFATATLGITPPLVPMTAIEKAGRAFRRRRIARRVAAAGLLLAPVAATSYGFFAPGPAATATVHTARIVAPGERVEVMTQRELWLTRDGLHWSTQAQTNQFRSIADLDSGTAGIVPHAEAVNGSAMLFGLYRGRGDAATVRIVTDEGTVTGSVVRLAGPSDWGAWYVTVPLLDKAVVWDGKALIHSITVRDASGQTIAQTVLS
ncbi:hypothetical protein KV205_35015 [Streptomyces sp. SKN60]|uniref:hypothetical protein n=1 Tax=Streptomyces sp. SKN60 TaxID=2855506 RepID=UPI002246849A|nr:hypothetical protein [Streptomyces sp. SKN60]MCX2185685.1 hypothetical protein [Streptomyces sp. SKN60]